MANQEHFKLFTQIYERGTSCWNQWRREHQYVQPDLRDLIISGYGRDFRRIDFSGADLRHTILSGLDLSEAILSDADLRGADLRNAKLQGAILNRADLNETDLRYADFRGARLHRAILSTFPTNPDDVEHRGVVGIHETILSTDLSEAILSDTDLSDAILSNAKLQEADLRNANLSNADLRYADLRGANLSNANLQRADLRGANLSNANLQGICLQGTIFADNDLSTAKGLIEVIHQGPSSLTLPTVQLPQDGRAAHFLRGAGIPDEWIDFYRAQIHSPIQYHSCFISYSTKDDMLARRLHADLQDHGVRCWFAPEDLKIGDKLRQCIDEAIHLQDKLLLLLSGHALASAWVEDEVEAALEKEQRQQREVLFPVRLDEHVMQTSAAWATKLRRTRHIGDFTHWTDPQAYQQAFERLLRDLKAEKAKERR